MNLDRVMKIGIVFALIFLLCGCGKNQVEPEDFVQQNASGSGEYDEDHDIGEAQDKASEEDGMMEKYREVLIGLKSDGVLPDLELERHEPEIEASYTIEDVDADGNKELIISYYGGTMSSMTKAVYGYDFEKKDVYLELTEFPDVTFYDNGCAIAFASHNHSLGEEEWPYTIYMYDKETGVYKWAGHVETWEKAYSETNNSGEPFPDELDIDGDGALYYIVDNEEDNDYGIERYRYNYSDYMEWRESLIGDAKEITVEYIDLTKDYILLQQ